MAEFTETAPCFMVEIKTAVKVMGRTLGRAHRTCCLLCLVFMSIFISLLFQMDPKLRPSFPDIVKRLEDVQRRLKAEEGERERIHIPAEMDKKSIAKGV